MEIWKPIVGYPKYEVSNCGRVRSFYSDPPRILKPTLLTNGYFQVDLCNVGKRNHHSVHRLVAQAFIPNPDGKPQINHINGIKSDNRVENLEWCTSSENRRHAIATGLQNTIGEQNPLAKLTTAQVLYIRENPEKLTQKQLGAMFGVNKSIIGDIQRGKTWKSAGGKIRDKIDTRIPDDVRKEIRRLYRRGVRGYGCEVLAKKFGIGARTILTIVREES